MHVVLSGLEGFRASHGYKSLAKGDIMDTITKLLLKLGAGNIIIRRVAGAIALALIAIAPELDVPQATEVFTQILSALVLLIAAKFEEVPEPKVKKQ